MFCGVAAHTVQRTGVHRGCNEAVQRYRGEQGCGKHLEFIPGILVVMLSDATFFRVSVFPQPPWLQSSIVAGGRIYRNRERSQLRPPTFHSFGDRGANHPLGDSNYGPNSPLSPGNLEETLSDFLRSPVT